jgi:hypothetical protein
VIFIAAGKNGPPPVAIMMTSRGDLLRERGEAIDLDGEQQR